MVDKINTTLPLFCPRHDCKFYGLYDNKITRDGTYITKNDNVKRQMFYCGSGKHRFSETGYSGLFGKHGSFKEYTQASKLFSFGLSNDKIADVLEKDQRTIDTWRNNIGSKSKIFHITICMLAGLAIEFLQMDELWSFFKRKNNQLWIFTAIESKTKFWITFEFGSRTVWTAIRLLKSIKMLLKISDDTVIKITTDKFAAYKNALGKVFYNITYYYLQIAKRRYRKKLITVKKFFVKGASENFPSGTQNTSFIERLNLTLRQNISFLRRKTLGYCKNTANLKNIMWINLFNYNYIRPHKSLRSRINNKKSKFTEFYKHNTPAMVTGLTSAPLTWRDLITAPVLKE
jgi:IS1 family transposase